jgi:hypothetical protein
VRPSNRASRSKDDRAGEDDDGDDDCDDEGGKREW